MIRRCLIALLILGLAGPAGAQAPSAEYKVPDPPKRPTVAAPAHVGLRGVPRTSGGGAEARTTARAPAAPAAPVIPPPRVAPGRQRDLTLMSPNLSQPTAPRTRGWDGGTRSGIGGAQCRTTCARDQYICLAGDGGDCSTTWRRCLAACPEGSAGAL